MEKDVKALKEKIKKYLQKMQEMHKRELRNLKVRFPTHTHTHTQ